MNKRFHMVSTAIRGDQEAPYGLEAAKQSLEEAEYLCFEVKLSKE